MTAIALSDLTEVKLDGNGVFDSLMRAAKIHLEDQYNKGSIRGPEYATVYLGQLESSMQTALAFLTAKQKVGLEATLLEKQVALAEVELQKANVELTILQQKAEMAVYEKELVQAQVAKITAETLLVPKQGLLLDEQLLTAKQQTINAEVEKRALEAKVCESQANFDLIKQNVLRVGAEITLTTQKIATEKAQILSLGVDADSVVGRQKALYAAQTSGFQRDAEQKVAGLYVDVYKTFRMTDNEFPIPTSMDSTNLKQVLDKLKAGISLPA